MVAKELIAGSFVPLKKTDTGTSALLWMDENKVAHLPVVEDNLFVGLIAETDIYNLKDPDEQLENLSSDMKSISILEEQHVFDVIRVFSSFNLTILPVVNSQNHYKGVITLPCLVSKLAALTSADSSGAVIVLEINVNDYLLTEIAGIVESNNAKIVGLYVTSHHNSTKMEVTVKVNTSEISPIMQTFNRYNYQIIGSFSEEDVYEDLKTRYDSLMRYLNI